MSEKPEQHEEWVPWQKGAEALNLQKSAFFHLVETKQIRTQPGTQPKKGRYSWEDILANKKIREQRQPRKPYRKRSSEPVVDWVTKADVPGVISLNDEVFQEMFLSEVERLTSWTQKNPHIFNVAFDPSDRRECLGYLVLIPLPEQTIFDLLSGKRQEESITLDDILTYDRSGAYTLLAYKVASRSNRAEDILLHLITSMADFWVDQFPSRYVKRIYTKSISRGCDYAVQLLHLAPRYDLGASAFELDLARPALAKPIQDFQERLKEKALLPSDLQWPPVLPAK